MRYSLESNPQVATNGVKTGWDAQENGNPCEASVWHVPTRIEVVDVLPVKQVDTSKVLSAAKWKVR